jgi:glycosyltransferase involved in cell wall biosynthesis
MALGTRRVELFSAMGFQRTQFDSLARLPDPPHEPFRFVSIGRLLHWKGFQFGLRAFAAAALDAAEYWIVGAGPERARLERHARVLGVESRVRFCGALSRPETLARLAACHVLVHPSLHDSGGWVCLEAMAAGRPVICLDLGGPAEQVTDATGIKVPARHPEQAVADLALAMSSLARDSERRSALAAAARQRVEEEYLWEHKGERLDSLFAALLAPQHEGAVSPAYP